jgi:hypothetical protein
MRSSTVLLLFALTGAIVCIAAFTELSLGPAIAEILTILFVVVLLVSAIVSRRSGD